MRSMGTGLGVSLGSLLTSRPDLLAVTAIARVLQLLIERQNQSSSTVRPLMAVLGQKHIVEGLIQTVRKPSGLWNG